MEAKTIFSKILALILGIIIIGSIVNILAGIFLIIYFRVFNPKSLGNTFLILYYLISTLVIIIGIYAGLKSYRIKNIFYTIFRPTKNSALISGILSLIVMILSIASGQKMLYLYGDALKQVSEIVAAPFLFVQFLILFYPFSALCYFIYKFGKDKLFKKSKVIVIILLIILNPIFIVYGSVMEVVYYRTILNEPCGLKITGFSEQSSARDSGMQIGEVIVKINDVEIDSGGSLEEYMASYDPSKDLIIRTNSNSYSIKPNFQDGKYMLGVNINQEWCVRSLIR